MALRTDDRGRSRLGAGAAALTTGRRHLDGNLRLETTQRVLERQPDRNLDVGAALRLRPSPARLPTVEDPAEQIAEVAEVVDREVAAAPPKLTSPGSKPGPRRPFVEPNLSYCFRFSGSESVS